LVFWKQAGQALKATALLYRLWLFLLLALLVLAAVPYFGAGVPGRAVLLSIVLPFALSLFSPSLGVAVLLGVASLPDGIATLFMHGTLSLHHQEGQGLCRNCPGEFGLVLASCAAHEP
jgi:hypothetical protein